MNMNQFFFLFRRRQTLAACLMLSAFAHAFDSVPRNVESHGGAVKFIANTNLSAISIHGQSSELVARASVQRENGKIILENLDARVDPKNLSTGMQIRDTHMRTKIFAAGDDTLPELHFTSAKALCPEAAKGQEIVCPVSGLFSIRGITKPFTILLRVKQDATKYKISGEGSLKLSAYGIEAPCQLGVCVADDVKLKIEFHAEERVERSKSEAQVASTR